jgi:hypothetical protein
MLNKLAAFSLDFFAFLCGCFAFVAVKNKERYRKGRRVDATIRKGKLRRGLLWRPVAFDSNESYDATKQQISNRLL